MGCRGTLTRIWPASGVTEREHALNAQLILNDDALPAPLGTFDQNPDRQLEGARLARTVTDNAPGKDTRRLELERLLASVREADTESAQAPLCALRGRGTVWLARSRRRFFSVGMRSIPGRMR